MVVFFGQYVLIKSLVLILKVYCAFQPWYKLWISSYAPSHWHPLLIMSKVNFVGRAFRSNDSFHMFFHFLLLFNLAFTWIGSTMTWSTSTLWLWLELLSKVRTCNPYNQRTNICAWIFFDKFNVNMVKQVTNHIHLNLKIKIMQPTNKIMNYQQP